MLRWGCLKIPFRLIMITWQEKYSTGIAELDKQHKNLFDYTNSLEQIIKDNALSRSSIDGFMRLLDQYIKVHFGHEENCMYKYHCPAAAQNKEAHQKFIERFKMTEDRIRTEDANDQALKDLHQFLESWLVEHICKIDTQIKACVH